MKPRKNNNDKYNGLKSDLNLLAKFVYLYESKIKRYSTEKEFKTNFPNAFYVYKYELDKRIRPATKKDIQSLSPNDTITLYITSGRYKVYDLCRHLRNSFSHALLEKEGKELKIIDKSGSCNTSIGYLQYKFIVDFLKEIIAVYEQ